MNSKKTWYLCVALAALLTVITLSPLVLTIGSYRPMLMGAPYTLWASFLTTAGLVVLAYFGSKYLLKAENTEEL